MNKIINFIRKRLPSPPLKTVADRLFLMSIFSLTIGGWVFGATEGFICLVAAIACYLSNFEFHTKKSILSRGIHVFLLSVISILLGTVNSSYILIVAPLYTFFLVFFEKNEYHKGMPIFFLPLALHMVSVGLPLNLVLQRTGSVSFGIVVALTAKLLIWPSKGEEPLNEKKNLFNSLSVKYALRKSIGFTLILVIGKFLGGGSTIWGAYLFLILHSPIDTDIFPKISKRICGTILGGLLYLPIGYFIESQTVIYILSIVALYLIFIFIGQCYFIAVTFITLNVLLSSVGILSFEAVIGQRFLYPILGGIAALLVSFLIPLKEELFCPSIK